MLRPLFLLFTLALLVPASGRAATIDLLGSTLNGNTVTDLLGGGGTLSLEIDVQNGLAIGLAVDLEPGDGPIAFDASVFNFMSEDLVGFALTLTGGAVFSVLGDANDSGGGAAGVAGGGSAATVSFVPPEPVFFTIGDALSLGALDWEIDVSGVTGGSFGLTLLAVPEPGLTLLLLGGFAAIRARKRF